MLIALLKKIVYRLTTENTNLWLCLYPDCYMLGCTERPADHSTQHNRGQPEHCLQLNIVSWRAWCYACNAEVWLTNNMPRVRGVLGTADEGGLSSRLVQYPNPFETEIMIGELHCCQQDQ